MNEPVHSRATGRSGPKRKTGCLTCRRRKVRCDEARPSCAHCIRLCLDCSYNSMRSKQSSSSPPTSARSTKREPISGEEAFLATFPQSGMATDHLWPVENDPTISYAQPFQDVFFSSLDNFDTGAAFQHSNFLHQPEVIPHGNGVLQQQQDGVPNGTPSAPHYHTNGLDQRQQILIDHFVRSANPVAVILPTHSEWTSASRTLLAMASESTFLLDAIYSLSSLHLFATRSDDCYEEAFGYYRKSSREVNNTLDQAHVADRQLKQAFATVFLLTHVELLAQTATSAKIGYWPLQNLQRAHHRVRQHTERIRLWTGTSKRLLTWLTLLQTKAEYNSGYNTLEHSSATLSKSTGDPYMRSPDNLANRDRLLASSESEHGAGSEELQEDSDDEDDSRTVAEVAYDTLNQPGLDFFLKSQAFTSRIINLDRYHRQRGTPEAEFETFKDAQQVSADLHSLWATRPTTMAFLKDPKGLDEVLKPTLARRLLLNLRVYGANFWALFIYLHRVAFKTYPASKDVQTAVESIIGFAGNILDADRIHNGTAFSPQAETATRMPAFSGSDMRAYQMQGTNALRSGSEAGLPATMLWPLFLAALESSQADRAWVLQTMREMDLRNVPNAARTVVLLEEVLRRQDSEGRRVDHRSVRQALFGGELSVLY